MSTEKLIAKYRKDAKQSAMNLFKADEYKKYFPESRTKEGKPKKVEDSTYLYIKSFVGDNGQRPLPSGTEYWNSPDIEIVDAAGNIIANNEMKANHQYHIMVGVQNDGDMTCNTANIELFLCGMGMGFDSVSGKLIGSQLVAINGHSSLIHKFSYKPSKEEVGHKCLFARTYSFASLDMPLTATGFDVLNDRHIAQQNTNVVEDSEAISFSVMGATLLNKDYQIKISTLEKKPVSAKLKMLSEMTFKPQRLAKMPRLEFVKKANPVGRTIRRPLPLDNIHPPSILPISNDRWELNLKKEIQTLKLSMPSFGLKKGEGTVVLLELIDKASKKSIGGLTFIVKSRL